ncbi:MAG: acetyl-CoA carboxylase biotin carboxylase subunit [Alphaproteobacteria bacterium]|nr:acetyl-CoA carboxylase biotin carboxylase subunit [Alphaproteobacteria bacterium]
MFEKILIANRGEIALRILRACHEMGIQTVAVHSTADADAMHVRLADESVCIGAAPPRASYMNIPAILSAASLTNASAIHPGYGFLSENPNFAEIIEEHGFTFIGPTPEHIRTMGDKLAAKAVLSGLGIPVVPGSDEAIEDIAEDIGYPVLVKAAHGGGGRGMQIVTAPKDLGAALAMARTEAQNHFKNGAVYLEKYLMTPRHIEIQILADTHGNVVHFGERDCSIQRRHQKLLEEGPSPALNADERSEIGAMVTAAIASLGYRGVGTLEFLYADGKFYFMEMNTRLQVEHPVTEMLSNVDLVREQIRVAAGAALGYRQNDVHLQGHAIECRVTAENPMTFIPSQGRITDYHPPGGLGVRIDSALYSGYEIPPYYDSLIAKLIVYGRNRPEALMRLRRALDEYVIGGIETTIPLFQSLVANKDFVNGTYDVHWLERFVDVEEQRAKIRA